MTMGDRISLQEALDRCLDDIASGNASVEQCLRRYPQFASELRPLLRTVAHLRAANDVRPGRAFKTRLRRELSGEPEPRGIFRLFSFRALVLLTLVAVVLATAAIWMGISSEVAGGSVAPPPPLTGNVREGDDSALAAAPDRVEGTRSYGRDAVASVGRTASTVRLSQSGAMSAMIRHSLTNEKQWRSLYQQAALPISDNRDASHTEAVGRGEQE